VVYVDRPKTVIRNQWTAPQRWVDATGPCPKHMGRVAITEHGLSGVFDQCPNCIDGRKREALEVACACVSRGPRYSNVGPDHDGSPDECPDCADSGRVTFAYATVEVLPTYDDRRDKEWPGPHVEIFRDTCYLWLSTNSGDCHLLDIRPVPGRDWVVQLDNVEVLV
jgi:hypothetical protein